MKRVCVLIAALLVLVGCTKEPPAYESKYTEPPAAPKPIAVAIIGDSYTGGSPEGGRGEQGWPVLVANQLGIRPTIGFEGGSGYVHPGNQRGGVFADQIPKVVNPGADLVVLFGSRNDKDAPADQLTAAVRDTLAKTRTAAPSARLLVIGPPWLTADPPPGIVQARDIVKNQAEAAGAVFIDSIGWFVNRPDLIGADGVHPNDAGHAYMAEMIAPAISAELPAPAG